MSNYLPFVRFWTKTETPFCVQEICLSTQSRVVFSISRLTFMETYQSQSIYQPYHSLKMTGNIYCSPWSQAGLARPRTLHNAWAFEGIRCPRKHSTAGSRACCLQPSYLTRLIFSTLMTKCFVDGPSHAWKRAKRLRKKRGQNRCYRELPYKVLYSRPSLVVPIYISHSTSCR